MPQDRSRLVRHEKVLVAVVIHSERRAMDEPGVENPEAQLKRCLEEEKTTSKGIQLTTVAIRE